MSKAMIVSFSRKASAYGKFFTQHRALSSFKDNDAVVLSFARTPIGKFGGSLASLSAPRLAATCITEAVKRAGIDKSKIEEAFIGNVVSAGIGQAPTRQAVMYSGLPLDCPSTTINKVCASGMKAAMMAAQSITSGYRNLMIAGGMESMSNIPYYLMKARSGHRLGHVETLDGLISDGLWDIYNNKHMGNCGDLCATKYGISRQEQDAFAIRSYERAAAAWESGKFNEEVVPCTVPGKNPTVVTKDEEFTNIKIDKVASLKAAFNKDGSITAANASKINDGASIMIIASGKFAREHNLKPIFRILGYGDAARDPVGKAPVLFFPVSKYCKILSLIFMVFKLQSSQWHLQMLFLEP